MIYPGSKRFPSTSSPFHHNPCPEYNDVIISSLLKLPNITLIHGGRLIGIERKDKIAIYEVESDDGVGEYTVSYDYLVLTISRAYRLPQSLTLLQNYPSFGILDLDCADKESIERIGDACKGILGYRDELSKILVYGSSLDGML